MIKKKAIGIDPFEPEDAQSTSLNPHLTESVNQKIKENLTAKRTKPRWSLLPFDAVELIVKRFTFGAEKYASWSFLSSDIEDSIFVDAAMRHMHAWITGDLVDPDYGDSHLVGAACNIIILLSREIRRNKK